MVDLNRNSIPITGIIKVTQVSRLDPLSGWTFVNPVILDFKDSKVEGIKLYQIPGVMGVLLEGTQNPIRVFQKGYPGDYIVQTTMGTYSIITKNEKRLLGY